MFYGSEILQLLMNLYESSQPLNRGNFNAKMLLVPQNCDYYREVSTMSFRHREIFL